MKKMTMKGTKSSECGLTKNSRSYVQNIKIHEETCFVYVFLGYTNFIVTFYFIFCRYFGNATFKSSLNVLK